MDRLFSSNLLNEAALASLILDVSTETTLKPGGNGSNLKVNTSSVIPNFISVGDVVEVIELVEFLFTKQKN